MNCKTKSFMTKKKAFTLIELLIVIAIIGILFIVLVSKVDFATDKAKATGVQTDFRSFQVAIETVAKENAGLATFGWDIGDTNGDRIRNSYDKGDANQNGVQDDGEVFVGSKVYSEEWKNVFTLSNPVDAADMSAIAALEAAINKNLDPKLHITINDDLTITMANQARDPWGSEYHGNYITNALIDNKDRGAIVIYSDGANKEFGSEHYIANGVVTVNVPGNNVYGKDDYSIAVTYTFVNGYGEVKTSTAGFSNNQGGNTSAQNVIITGSVASPEQLQSVYDFVYYSSLETAISDIENNTLNGSLTKNTIGVYTDSEGNKCVILLEDYAVANQVVVNSDITINLGGKKLTGAANGLIQVNGGEVVIDGRLSGSSIIVTATETITYLRCIRLLGGHTTVLGGTYIGYGNYSETIGTQGISVGASATATLENCYVYGTHVGVQANSSILVRGGTYEGYGHGGFYLMGSDSVSYIKDAVIREADMPAGYADLTSGDNKTGIYIGGQGGKKNITVYIDNCRITGENQAIALRGSNGEQNTKLYISNSVLNLDATNAIRVDNDTFSVYLGVGNNFTIDNVQRPNRVTETGETYKFD